MRPLSFLSDIERLIREFDDTAIPGETARAIDFRQGLARLQLSPDGDTIQVQCFELADGRDCLKAVIHWRDSEAEREVSVYPTETNRQTIWRDSARKVAQLWLEGAPGAAAPVTGNLAASKADNEILARTG